MEITVGTGRRHTPTGQEAVKIVRVAAPEAGMVVEFAIESEAAKEVGAALLADPEQVAGDGELVVPTVEMPRDIREE